jgi:hypothetical protein
MLQEFLLLHIGFRIEWDCHARKGIMGMIASSQLQFMSVVARLAN